VKRLVPRKPIRYLINTHHHFDHSGGIRAYVDEGVTIVTHQINKDFYEKAFSTARSLNPGRLEQSGKKANIETVADRKVLSDGARTLELHLIKDNPHNDGMLMAFLPKEEILIEVDVYTPPPSNTPAAEAGAASNPSAVNLADNVEKLKLDFDKILPLHGARAATRGDLYLAIGKPVPDMTQILNPPPATQTAGQGGPGIAAGVAANEPAAMLLESACTTCHNLVRVQAKRATEDEWSATIARMKFRGARVSDEETLSLLDYLTRTYR
jgi:glyoxylase-like metal-dependent hydrolase (beta-lactamase superfamily II)